jgi:DNA replication factor GINS
LLYQTLYETWKKEKESRNLQILQKTFYSEASSLIRAQIDEVQTLDEQSLHAQLQIKQKNRTQILLRDLIETRFRKIYLKILNGETFSTESLTSEEENIVNILTSVKEEFDTFSKHVLSGKPAHIIKTRLGDAPRRIMVRFLQEIPAIVGANAKIYGPFKAEDIATLPIENAESLIKRGVALRLEVE